MFHALLAIATVGAQASGSDKFDSSWVRTKHSITASGQTIHYTATAGYMPLKNEKGEVQAKIFFTAYTEDGANASTRPVTFCWNGGPGSSSIWVHMGCMGPRRVHYNSDGTMPNPPFHMEDNDNTWLPKTDLVFVDPVGTGFSKAEAAPATNYWGVQGDLESVANFIRLYITDTDRWKSPVYLAGESYGTFRAAGLSNMLLDGGLAVSGITLISSAVNFNIFVAANGNELPYMLFVPTFTAVAAYHKKLSPEFNANPYKAIDESEKFAAGEYWTALERGDLLTEPERKAVAAKLSKFTGISADYILMSNLRLVPETFEKELLRKEGYTIGRNDARVLGTDQLGITATTDFDPADAGTGPAFTSALNTYMRDELGFKTEDRYDPLNLTANGRWNWGQTVAGSPDQSDALHQALLKNPHLRVMDCQGIYDFATPFFGSFYTLQHLGLPDRLKDHIWYRHFEGGHMMYINKVEQAKLRDEEFKLIDATSGN